MTRIKNIARFVLILGSIYLIGSTCIALTSLKNNYVSGDLEEGDSLSFGRKTFVSKMNTSGSTRSHSYDGKRYEIDHENGVFVLSHLHPSNVESQNEMSATYVTGKLMYVSDTLLIHLKSQYKYLYVATLDSTKPVDVYTGTCTIKAASKDLDGQVGKMYLSSIDNGYGNWHISSLPKGVDKDQLYKKDHPRKTIAKFDLLQIENNGVIKTYNQTDLLIIGANELTLKNQE